MTICKLQIICFAKDFMEEREEKILKKIEEQNAKIDAVYKSVEKTRKMFLWTIIGSVVTFLLPIIGLIFIIPWFLHIMSNAYKGLL